ncbi:MAG: cation:proton antiporter [Nitrososphaeria archaeon]
MLQDSSVVPLYEIGLIIVISSLASELFKRLRLPGLIGAIVAGIFIGGPGGIGLVTDLAVVNILSVLGSVMILFATGLEFEASAFWKSGRKAFLLTTLGVLLSVLCGYMLGIAIGWPEKAALLLGVAIAPSGTSVIAQVLNVQGKVETGAGSTLLTACVVDDVESILLLTIAFSVVTMDSISWIDAVGLVSSASLFIFLSIFFGSKILPKLIQRYGQSLSDEVLFAVLLGLGLVLAFAATQVGLAAITGAFIMGAIIPYKKVGEKMGHRIFMMKEILASLFFASIGLSINPYEAPSILPVAAVVLGVGILSRFLGGAGGGILANLQRTALIPLSIGLAVRGEMSLIIAREAVARQVVGYDFLTLLAVVTIGSMLVVLPLFSKSIEKLE